MVPKIVGVMSPSSWGYFVIDNFILSHFLEYYTLFNYKPYVFSLRLSNQRNKIKIKVQNLVKSLICEGRLHFTILCTIS